MFSEPPTTLPIAALWPVSLCAVSRNVTTYLLYLVRRHGIGRFGHITESLRHHVLSCFEILFPGCEGSYRDLEKTHVIHGI